ncbi:MAG: thymidylate synthase [Paraclostridium sp.]
MENLSSIDRRYLDIAKYIQDGGFDNTGDEVRTKWKDGTPAYTKSILAHIETYDLSKGLPITSLRNINWKNALDEILWIFQKKSNKVKDLKSKIWDAWATYEDEEGNKTIGKAYGYQLGKPFKFNGVETNQVDRLIKLLKENPRDRRMVTNMFNFDDLDEMGLAPCAFMTMWSTIGNKLNMTLVQRSGDFLTAAGVGSWNCVQYALLQYIMAEVTGYEVGIFVHIVNDLHIYDRHFDVINMIRDKAKYDKYEEMALGSTYMTRCDKPLPKVVFNRDVTDFYDFKIEDIDIVGYEPDKTREFNRFEVAE